MWNQSKEKERGKSIYDEDLEQKLDESQDEFEEDEIYASGSVVAVVGFVGIKPQRKPRGENKNRDTGNYGGKKFIETSRMIGTGFSRHFDLDT